MLRGPRDWGVPADPWNVLEATATSGTTLANKIRVISEGGGEKHLKLLMNQSGEANVQMVWLRLSSGWLGGAHRWRFGGGFLSSLGSRLGSLSLLPGLCRGQMRADRKIGGKNNWAF